MQRGQLAGSSAIVSTSGGTVTLNPTSDFFPGELVQASVTPAIQSTGGQGADAHVWQLRTAVSGGSGEFSDSSQSLGTFNSTAVSLGDVDGDGDLDAFVANRSQANRVWVNQGGLQSGTAGTFSDSGQILGNFNSVRVKLGDLDADGDLDAFVAMAGNQPNRVWINQGGRQGGTAGQFSDSGQSLGNSFSYDLSLGDVDGDGDLDAFAANYNQGHRVWLGVGGNQAPTLDALANVTVDEDAPQQTVSLAGISAGSGETQPLRVTAESNNTGLIPNPTVAYTTPQVTGTLMFTAVADASGSATITVTVEDGGADNDLSTTADNAQFSRTFDVTVNAVNDVPTLDAISSLTINQGASEQTVNLAGVAAGGGESQPLRVTAVSDNTGLIPNPSVTYVSPQATGTLNFTPVATASGSATVTVTVEDGGLDNDLNTSADNAKVDRTFSVTVNAAAATVTNVVLNGGQANRSGLASLMFQFSEPTTVDAAGSLMLWNHTTGAAVSVSAAPLVNNGTAAVTWDLSGIALPAGRYTATLPKSAASLAATHTKSFHVLPGDSDGDSGVGFGDFGQLAGNFNASGGPAYRPGDMDGNGDVGFTDFGILATNFNSSLPALMLDFGDAPESGTSFPTTLANNGARHVLGSGLSLGATVDAEADGQPDANAAGDGADEDGVTFATLTAGTSPTITVTAVVPGTAVLNGWIDFNGDGDWNDAGEQIFADQALSNGTNSLTAPVPAGAVAGQAFGRLRVTSVSGYSYAGLAKDGEVEDYQVTIVAAKDSSSRSRPPASFTVWAEAFTGSPSSQQTTLVAPQQHPAEPNRSSVELVGARHPHRAVPSDTTMQPRRLAELVLLTPLKVVDPAVEEVASSEHGRSAGFGLLGEQLVDRVFEGEVDGLLLDSGSRGAI